MAALHDLLTGPDWHNRAACATHDPELWWIEDTRDLGRKIALDICASCPVREQCLQHALSEPERDGIWGGKLPHERRRMVYVRRLEAERHAPPQRRQDRRDLEDPPEVIAARRGALLAAVR